MQSSQHFFSEGLKISASLYLPGDLPEGDRRPGIVVCHGFTGIKEFNLPVIAERICDAGYVALTFDYRGFGASEGLRGRLIPWEQVEDVCSAVTFLSQRKEADPDRIGLYGISFGGSIVSVAAALDRRVKATVAAAGGFGNGARWMRAIRREWEWLQFQERLEKDRVGRVLHGTSQYVSPADVMPPDPDVEKVFAAALEEFPEMAVELTLDSADAIIGFSPEEYAHQISPNAILFLVAEKDAIIPADETRAVYERAREPKEWVVLRGWPHSAFSIGETRLVQVDRAMEFYRKYLPV